MPRSADLPGHRASLRFAVRRVVGDAQQQRDQDVVRDERRAAVGDERQRHAGERQHAGDPRHDDERLDADQHRETGGEEPLEGHLGAQRDAQPGADDQEVGDEHAGGTDEAELLADGGEDEVGLGVGDPGRASRG